MLGTHTQRENANLVPVGVLVILIISLVFVIQRSVAAPKNERIDAKDRHFLFMFEKIQVIPHFLR